MEENENEKVECYSSENWRAGVTVRMREQSAVTVSMKEVGNWGF